jgi:hypothetical protein
MGEETAHHILFEWEVLGRIRFCVLGHPWIRARDNSPRTHQAPAEPDKESKNFLMRSRLCQGELNMLV